MATTVLGCPDASTTRGVAKALLPALSRPSASPCATLQTTVFGFGWVICLP